MRDYLGVARRRKWLIAVAIVIVPVLAVGLSLQQRKMYRASSQVLLVTSNVANQLNGITDPGLLQDAARRAQTQADLARVPAVARETLKIAQVRRTVDDFLNHSSATAQTNADLLVLAADDHNPAVARRLASSYAIAFSRYRGQLDTAPYANARTRANKQLAELAASGGRDSQAYQALLQKRNQLDQYIALLNQNAVPVKPADKASQIQPRPVRTGILGLVLGLVLGFVLVFLKEALDTKVRSAEEIEHQLGLPLLARLPEPPRKLRKHYTPVMVAEPHSAQAEMFRLLRTNLEFVRLPNSPRTILVTSALEREGKSTTCANLAITLARAGQRVALVDLDLRRPALDRFFDLTGQPGLTQVALRRAEFEDLLAHPLALTGPRAANNGAAPSENGSGPRIKEGELVVVGTGPIPPNPGEFVSTPAVSRILDELRTRFDTVLIDTPPALQVGDAMAISTRVDAVVVICRMNVVRRPTLTELRRALDACPAEKLGFVLAGAESEDGYYQSGAYYYKPAQVPEAVNVT